MIKIVPNTRIATKIESAIRDLETAQMKLQDIDQSYNQNNDLTNLSSVDKALVRQALLASKRISKLVRELTKE